MCLTKAYQKAMLFFKNLIKNIKKKSASPSESSKNEPIINKKSQLKFKTSMSMFSYGVGGNEVKVDANEAIQEIQENKSLLVSKLTTEDVINPEIITGLKTVEDVFRHFSPSISITHETEDGASVEENFAFKNLGDFTPKNLTQNSPFLQGLSNQQEQYNNITRQLRNNKVLANMLKDDTSKAAFVDTLKSVIKELENN